MERLLYLLTSKSNQPHHPLTKPQETLTTQPISPQRHLSSSTILSSIPFPPLPSSLFPPSSSSKAYHVLTPTNHSPSPSVILHVCRTGNLHFFPTCQRALRKERCLDFWMVCARKVGVFDIFLGLVLGILWIEGEEGIAHCELALYIFDLIDEYCKRWIGRSTSLGWTSLNGLLGGGFKMRFRAFQGSRFWFGE